MRHLINNYWCCLPFFIFLGISCESQENAKTRLSDSLDIDTHEVTIGQFSRFVQSTNFISAADSIGWSAVFDFESTNPGWKVVANANWQRIDGVHNAEPTLPVTHVSYKDACAYCAWKQGRLPTADEWDRAAGNTIVQGNIWEGVFPIYDAGTDGFKGRAAPVGSFLPNRFGIHDLFGNVWEWTSTSDTSKGGEFYRIDGVVYEKPIFGKIIKGGSFLCDLEVCAGYFPDRFQVAEINSGLNHLGFRCVYE